ncbi:MAG: asparagine synthase (glutamine-hydrolyzing) [Nitrospirae bacterium]|nr:asparagine synthase (glutamine-hydrolyzing) [Nitrospirota bacterium]
MCGICGVYIKGTSPVLEKHIIKMRDIMIERGPDGAGIYMGEHIGLGHRRLKIIDLSDAAQQPMCNEDKQLWMVFNGEIYNFGEIRENLVKAGHVFKSKSDSEVIIHGYEEWGVQVFEKLNGMFAMAIWDARKEMLILCRDRVGKKPLFYLEVNESVIFASDIKSIINSGYVCNLVIDEKAIDCYLAHICIPQAHTIYKGIKKVQPSHYVVFQKDKTIIQRYWYLSFKKKEVMDENQYIQVIDSLLHQSVKDRLIGDVPIGAFLSGGIDSSLIVALMSSHISKVKTFSVGFDYQPYNELSFAKKISDKYDTDHHELILNANCINILPKLVWNYGEPFADSSAVPSYYISKLAREYVKVVLTGDGGDESFAGYDRTQTVNWALKYKRFVPRFISKNILYPFFNTFGDSTDRSYRLKRIRLYENYINETTRLRYKNEMGNYYDRENFYSDQFMERLEYHHPSHVYEEFYDYADGVDDIDKVLFVDFNAILPDAYQVKMDVASMSNSLEVRAPFLDYRIMEFAAKIPSGHKIKLKQTKYLLKKLSEKYLPKENIYRSKWGFAIPVGPWFRKELKPYLYNIILSDKARTRGYFNYDYIQHIINEHLVGKDHEYKLWSLLWLELWHRLFIDKDITPDTSMEEFL